MIFYYFIYIPLIIITFLILKIYTKTFNNKYSKFIFLIASFIGLFTPYLVAEYNMLNLTLAYIVIAAIIWYVTNKLTKPVSTENITSDNLAIKNKTVTKPVTNNSAIIDYKVTTDYNKSENMSIDNNTSNSIDNAKNINAELLITKFEEFQLAKTSKQYKKAMDYGKKLMSDSNLPKHFQQMLAWEMADVLLELPDYDYAISQLRLAISIAPSDSVVANETETRVKLINAVRQELLMTSNASEIPWSEVPSNIISAALTKTKF